MKVSICIPTYNGAKFVAEAVRSALSQGGSVELVISDSGSNDGTLEIIRRECAGAAMPVRILEEKTPGMVSNWNALIRAAQGEYVKFLFQDDLLHKGCVERMLAAARGDRRIGLVFCRRDLLIDSSAESSPVTKYLLKYAELHKGFGKLKERQSGSSLIGERTLFDQPLNKIGEPTAVMVRKDAAIEAGLFSVKMRQLVDWEFWVRIMARCDVAYVDERLATFRVHEGQMSVENEGVDEDREYADLLNTLASANVFGHLHRSIRMRIYRQMVASGATMGETPSRMDRVCVAMSDAGHAARKALGLA